jgi:hypothetical protein
MTDTAILTHSEQEIIDNNIHEENDVKIYSKNETDMLLSLAISIEKSGGNSVSIMKNIDEMSVSELIQNLAPNGVRFTHSSKKRW